MTRTLPLLAALLAALALASFAPPAAACEPYPSDDPVQVFTCRGPIGSVPGSIFVLGRVPGQPIFFGAAAGCGGTLDTVVPGAPAEGCTWFGASGGVCAAPAGCQAAGANVGPRLLDGCPPIPVGVVPAPCLPLP